MPKKTFLLLFFLSFLTSSTAFAAPDTRQKICQSRQNIITNRTQSIIGLANTMLINFDLHTQRVQNYYSQKLVPQGKFVPNYGDLVTQIQTHKSQVRSALSKAQAESANFTCSQPNPQKSLNSFKSQMQEVKTALKNYRNSVRNLIVAVRTTAASPQKS